jgi:aspartyl-tRNA(Asn)/glutamyl-tRNA(Gln) amidotransferase subunit C
MRLTTEEVRHIALLARIGMTDEDIEKMRNEMSHIMENFDVLSQVDTEGVEPTGHSVDLDTVMREDKSADSLPREDALANAPLRDGDFVRVKAVLE